MIVEVVGYDTTADLDGITDRLDQVDGEIADLASDFDTLDDAVSTEANAADVDTESVSTPGRQSTPSRSARLRDRAGRRHEAGERSSFGSS